MTTIIHSWAGESKNIAERALANTGIELDKETTANVWEVAKLLYDAGLQVMVKHSMQKGCDTIYFDTRLFRQR
jgi:hypothetical protein